MQTPIPSTLGFLWILAALAALGSPAFGQTTTDNEVEFDLYAFEQSDGEDGAQPQRAEGLSYQASRFALRLTLTDALQLRLQNAISLIDAEDNDEFASSVSNASTTAASDTWTTSDSTLTLDIGRASDEWRFSPGFYYHHEFNLQAGGVDFGARWLGNGGDTTVSSQTSFRVDTQRLRYWSGDVRDGKDRDERVSLTHNLAVTQLLGPSWTLSGSLQGSFQTGLLLDPYNYVVRYNGRGSPDLFMDERLPRDRWRLQGSLDLRFTPSKGLVFALGAAAYQDDWGLSQISLEPSITLPIDSVRWRWWYRVAWQDATAYYRERPTDDSAEYQTQDSDLGTWTLHSPGTELSVELPGDGDTLVWRLRVSLWGFYRTDGLTLFGGSLGLAAGW